MTKSRKSGGFTLAEMLIVVAIIMVLMGVSFVAVQNHQRSMTRLEFDTIAREIFVAAQNHLTEAESQGYLQNVEFGNEGTLAEDKIENKIEAYFVLNDESYNDILKLILPPYAVDATVLSGSYIIRYQPSSAKVLDVFYSHEGKSGLLTVAGTKLTKDDYEKLMGTSPDYRNNPKQREQYNGAVVGWYGNEKPIKTGERLKAPTFEVINKDRLYVKVTDPNSTTTGHNIKLIVTGEISEAEAYFSVVKNSVDGTGPRLQPDTDGTSSNSRIIMLDDITDKDLHFANLDSNNGKSFIPGEDLLIKAVAYSTETLANIAMSAEKTTNSLFADPATYVEGKTVIGSAVKEEHIVGIASIRHLENLDASISNLGKNSTADNFEIKKAAQLSDLSWRDFHSEEGNIVLLDEKNLGEYFWPVTPTYVSEGDKNIVLDYDGQHHSISNVKVDTSGDAGLFAKLANGSTVSNLELIDFEIKSTGGNAGALAGTVGTTKDEKPISNVLARNSIDETTKKETLDKNIEASGDAGGLIGKMDGGSIEKSAAALYVKSNNANAGGLIGTVTNGGTVEACYSGGHTFSGAPKYTTNTQEPNPARTPYAVRYYSNVPEGGVDNPPIYNVRAGTNAGGLIGNAGTATISHSYSTCSATGATAGGFIGTGSNSGTITNCYCTGLVVSVNPESITGRGAFAGSYDGTLTGCQYFEIINEMHRDDDGKEITGYNYLKPLGNKTRESTEGVTAFDQSATTYDAFTKDQSDWKLAHPYDAGGTETYGLKVFYKVKDEPHFNLQTVKQLGANVNDTTDPKDFVADHYGDWPAPEEFIFN